jgi:general stress protein YciG
VLLPSRSADPDRGDASHHRRGETLDRRAAVSSVGPRGDIRDSQENRISSDFLRSAFEHGGEMVDERPDGRRIEERSFSKDRELAAEAGRKGGQESGGGRKD